MDPNEAQAPAEIFEGYRDYLFSVAYRMLGSVMEAEDMVQETYLRWQRVKAGEVDSPKSYLATIVARLCLDQLKSARARREQYIGPWLPEPLIADPGSGPAETLARAESLTMAFLVLLESLEPEQRVVYFLREVFDYGYHEISEMIDKSEAACRQMVSRARKYIEERRPRFPVTTEESEQAVEEFMGAVNGGNMEGLLSVLKEDAVWTSDGGGMRGVARRPIEGAEKVARFALRLAERAAASTSAHRIVVNGGPGLLIKVEDRPYATLCFELSAGQISAVRAVVNPDKLRHLSTDDSSPDGIEGGMGRPAEV